MKKIIILLFLLLTVTTAVPAQSLFPVISNPTPEPEDEAPSYSSFANVEPDEEKDFGPKGKVLSYNNVTEDEYLQFGDYLSGFGFEVTQSNVNGRAVELMLNNGKFNIGLSYNADDELLQLIYEEGVDYLKMDYFPGYIRVTMSDTIKINKWADIQMAEFELNESRRITPWIKEPSIMASVLDPEPGFADTWLMFSFLNKTNETLKFYSDPSNSKLSIKLGSINGKNDIGEITLHYISDEEVYYSVISLLSDHDFFNSIRSVAVPIPERDSGSDTAVHSDHSAIRYRRWRESYRCFRLFPSAAVPHTDSDSDLYRNSDCHTDSH